MGDCAQGLMSFESAKVRPGIPRRRPACEDAISCPRTEDFHLATPVLTMEAGV